jgi:alpha-beta hydrolase superfamily lysophospholipase
MLPPESNLELLSHLPSSANSRAPVLFVHGAYTDAWCWSVNFMPHFAQSGHAAYALSLRGHGGSGGESSLVAASLDDYLHDVCYASEAITRSHGTAPVLVGHSMGAAIVQRLIDMADRRAVWSQAALLAPVPPSGLLPATARLLMLQPDLLWHIHQVTVGARAEASLRALRGYYFTDAVPNNLLAALLDHLHPESPRAVLDLSIPLARLAADAVPLLPADLLVLSGEADAIFPPDLVSATASRYGVDPIIVPGLPHMLMLEPGWEIAARHILDWIN